MINYRLPQQQQKQQLKKMKYKDGNKENEVQTEGFNLKKHCQILLHPSTIKKVKLP